MKRAGVLILLGLLTTTILISYQNCGDVRLSKVPQKILHSYAKSGDICSLPALSSTDKVKLTFIVDMSASNATTEKRNASGQIIEHEGSDKERQRLAIIRDFLTKDCLKANDSTRVAVVGFAHQKILPPGTLCDRHQFKPVQDYLTPGVNDPIDFLEAEHDYTKQDCLAGGGRCSEYTTRYDEGVDCGKLIVSDDVTNGNDPDGKKAYYMTFFLTDGEPTVPGLPSYEITTPQYVTMKNNVKIKIRDMRNIAEEQALGLTLRPIFYGGEYLARKDPSGKKANIARDILTVMANEGLTEYIFMDNINQLDLCKYLVSGTRVPYKLKQFVATNLTIRKVGHELIPDSDMDGIPDREEAERGFDPTRARSLVGSELLDGFCGGLNASQCVNSSHADCGNPNALGLTTCETTKYGLTNGLDSDADDFIDIMEVIKGTGPNIPTGYVDGDSLSEFEELMIGRDAHYPDDNSDPAMLMRYRRWPLQTALPGCPQDQESLSYSLDFIPMLPTLATQSNDPVSTKLPWMNHDKDVNVIMLYYILTPANQSQRQELKDQVYVKYMKVHTAGFLVDESQFVKAGDLGDTFSEFTEDWK